MSVSEPAAAPLESPAPAARLPALDAMRLVAAAVIVWIHTVESDTLARTTLIGRFAVPFFTIASLWLLGQSLRRRPMQSWGRYAASRLMLLYVPFLLWTVIYLTARYAKHRLLHVGMPIEFNAWILVLGVTEQLWFLPALLVVSVLCFPVIRLAVRGSVTARAVVCAAALIATAVAAMLPFPGSAGDVAIDNTVQGVYFMLPAVFVGVALAVTMSRPLSARVGGLVFGPLWIIAIAINVLVGRSAGIEMAAGLAAFLLAASAIDGAAVRLLATGGGVAMGIYLSHVLFVEGIQAAAHRSGFEPSAGLDVVVGATAFAAAWGASVLLRRTWLVPR